MSIDLETLTLSEEQLDVAEKLASGVDTRERVQTLGGFAGTGKTTLIKTLQEWLPGMVICAYTGKAANILRRKGIDASTIHSAIYLPRATVPVTFQLRDEIDGSGFIVDEASMVGETIYKDLLSFGLPCVFVGDHGQLPPIERGLNLMADPQYRLEHVHRHAGDIPRFAEWLRLGNPAGSFKPQTDAVRIVRQVGQETALSADQIICAYNRTRVSINTEVRRALGRTERLEVNDRVMCLRNSAEVGLFNGMQGTVKRIEWRKGTPVIDLDTYDGVLPALWLDVDQLGKEKLDRNVIQNKKVHPFDYAHAITCHKAQGDEWPSVLVHEQRCPYWEHQRWAYTAASRARESLTWVLG